jgi:hypothetical protein
MHVEATTQITHPFAEAELKTLLLFVNVKQEKYDSSSSNWVFCFQNFVFSVKINLCCHVYEGKCTLGKMSH